MGDHLWSEMFARVSGGTPSVWEERGGLRGRVGCIPASSKAVVYFSKAASYFSGPDLNNVLPSCFNFSAWSARLSSALSTGLRKPVQKCFTRAGSSWSGKAASGYRHQINMRTARQLSTSARAAMAAAFSD